MPDCGGISRASAAPAPGTGHVMCHLTGVVWTSGLDLLHPPTWC